MPEFPADRCDGSDTGRIQKTEYDDRDGSQGTDDSCDPSCGTEQHFQNGNHAFFGHETADKGSDDLPVPKSDRGKNRYQKACNSGKNAVLGVFYQLELEVETLQEPYHDRGDQDHGECSLQEILCLFPEKKQHIFCSRHTVIGKLHDKGNRFSLEHGLFKEQGGEDADNDAQQKRLFLSLLLLAVALLMAAREKRPSVAVVVDPATRQALASDVDAFVPSMEFVGKRGILVVDRWCQPDSIRKELKRLYDTEGLEGAVLVGNIPVPMVRDAHHLTTAFKMNPSRDWQDSSVPSDRIYDDFDLRFDYLKQDSEKPLLHYYSLRFDSIIMAEALGWFCYSIERDKIAGCLTDCLHHQHLSPRLRREMAKAVKRIQGK